MQKKVTVGLAVGAACLFWGGIIALFVYTTPAPATPRSREVAPRSPSREDIFKSVLAKKTVEHEASIVLHKNNTLALFQLACLQNAAAMHARGIATNNSGGGFAKQAGNMLKNCSLENMNVYEKQFGSQVETCVHSKTLALVCMKERELSRGLHTELSFQPCAAERAASVVICDAAEEETVNRAKRPAKKRGKRGGRKRSNDPLDLPSLRGR